MEIIKYLNDLKVYLYGDLEIYKQICNEVRKKEESQINEQMHITASLSSEDAPSGKSSTDIPPIPISTTTKTTAYPGSDQDTPKYFRSTIPHVLSLFATIDFLGFLQSTNAVGNSTKNNYEEFFNNCKEISNDEIKLLTDFFRHGHSHQFFAKNGFGISDSNPVCDNRKIFYLDKDKNITLNVEILIELTKCQFEIILKTYNDNEDLKLKAINQYNKIIKKTEDNINNLGFTLEDYKFKLES